MDSGKGGDVKQELKTKSAEGGKGDSAVSNSKGDADLTPKVENRESKRDVKVERPPSGLKKSEYYKCTYKVP